MDPTSLQILTVFLASPSDLEKERRAAHSVVQEINKIFGETIGWNVDLRGWEDTLPGAARPQEAINHDIRRCHLFVGMLHRRWGQATGVYSSGFEEEFELACELRQTHDHPEIWLLFKKIDEEALRDPGEQLQRVLAFRKARIEAHDMLFKEFSETEEFSRSLREWLQRYILSIHEASAEELRAATSSPRASITRRDRQVAVVPTSNTTPSRVRQQVLAVLDCVRDTVDTGELNSIPANDKVVWTDAILRLHLLSSAWLSERSTGDLLSEHAINTYYTAREHIEPSEPEKRIIFRTLVKDDFGVAAGWYWFRELNQDAVCDLLSYHAVNDPNPSVRSRAIRLSTQADLMLPDGNSVLSRLFSDPSLVVRSAVLRHVAELGRVDQIGRVESLMEDSDAAVKAEARTARLTLLGMNEPDRALTEFLSDDFIPPSSTEAIKAAVRLVKTETLLQVLDHADADVRSAVIVELAGRKEMSEERIRTFVSDIAPAVRALAYEILLDLGLDVSAKEIRDAFKSSEPPSSFFSFQPPLDGLIERAFDKKTKNELLSALDWLSIDGPIAYKVLATKYFHEEKMRVRADIANNFDSIRQETIDRFRSQYGPAAQAQVDALANLEDFIRSNYESSALAGLAVNRDRADAKLLRKIVSQASYNIGPETIHALERLAASEDVEILLRLAENGKGEMKDIAARAAMRIAPGLEGVTGALLKSTDSRLVFLAIQSYWRECPEDIASILGPYLLDDAAPVREAAAAIIVLHETQERAKEILSEYIARDTYFYNVVHWFDRVLFAPEPLRKLFTKELESKIQW